MTTIRYSVEIKATPAAVFDLISRVEDFWQYTSFITSITPIGPDMYRWVVKVAGITLDWDMLVTECASAQYFAWRSIRGIENSGHYVLAPTPHGTQVSLTLNYRLQNRVLEGIISPLASHLTRRIAAEVLSSVKQRLER